MFSAVARPTSSSMLQRLRANRPAEWRRSFRKSQRGGHRASLRARLGESAVCHRCLIPTRRQTHENHTRIGRAVVERCVVHLQRLVTKESQLARDLGDAARRIQRKERPKRLQLPFKRLLHRRPYRAAGTRGCDLAAIHDYLAVHDHVGNSLCGDRCILVRRTVDHLCWIEDR